MPRSRPRRPRRRAQGARCAGAASTARCEPIHAPSSAPAIAVAKPSSAASGSSSDGHGIGIQTCDQPHSAARPSGADAHARTRARTPAGGARRPAAAPTPSTTSASTTYSGKCGVVSPSTGPTTSASPPREREEEARPRRARCRGRAHSADRDQRRRPAASMISIGWKHEAELGHAEVELGLERGQADQQAAGQRRRARTRSDPVDLAVGAAADAVGAQRPRPAARRCRSASSTAPPISIRWVGPHSVTSWPNRRCQTSSSGKPISAKAPQAQISTPPSGACQSRAIRIARRARAAAWAAPWR